MASDNRLFAGVIAGATVVGMICLTAPFVVSRSPLPYMATPGVKVQRALGFLRSSGYPCNRFVDLGSGDGQGVYEAVRSGYRHATGVELNSTLYMFSQARRLRWASDERTRSRFTCQDMFGFDVSNADTIMVFGVKPLMQPIAEKLQRECEPGTHILSYRFRLPISESSSSEALLDADIVYDEEEMRIYRINSKR